MSASTCDAAAAVGAIDSEPTTGDPLPFSGYVELIAALERMRRADQPAEREAGSEPQPPA